MSTRAKSVILGTTADRQCLQIGDLERRNGLYILGKPRMGKSWLIINMILQDIENGHGVFFIDPHGDAIDEIVSRRIITGRDRILLELDNPECSCGINILACPDISDPQLRADMLMRH
jgi:DNA helicase HerA-like ATPase